MNEKKRKKTPFEFTHPVKWLSICHLYQRKAQGKNATFTGTPTWPRAKHYLSFILRLNSLVLLPWPLVCALFSLFLSGLFKDKMEWLLLVTIICRLLGIQCNFILLCFFVQNMCILVKQANSLGLSTFFKTLLSTYIKLLFYNFLFCKRWTMTVVSRPKVYIPAYLL